MTRKDWFLPSFKSPLCTLHFMQLVYEYRLYLPKQVDMTPCNRSVVPSNAEINLEL
jgi:hypothetical protein